MVLVSEIWKCLNLRTSKVKHLFVSETATIPVCGMKLHAYKSKWVRETPKLATLPECKKCLILEDRSPKDCTPKKPFNPDDYIWMYSNSSEAISKHAFVPGSDIPLCRRNPQEWGNKWLSDEEGLAAKDICKSCVKKAP